MLVNRLLARSSNCGLVLAQLRLVTEGSRPDQPGWHYCRAHGRLWLTRPVEVQLFGLSPHDPSTHAEDRAARRHRARRRLHARATAIDPIVARRAE